MPLPTRILGRTGVEVTQLGFGAMEVRGQRIWKGRPCSDEQARTILTAVLEAGITLIDTANCYGQWADGGVGGESEIVIGRWIRSRGVRDQVVVATGQRYSHTRIRETSWSMSTGLVM